MTVDLIIPSLRKPHAVTSFSLLRHLPWPAKIHIVIEGKSWPEAVNLGLAESQNDVVLMDDDIFLRPETFAPLLDDAIYKQADIFGFKLLTPEGGIQHAGGYWDGHTVTHYGFGEPDNGQHNEPRFVGHVTTSLCYVKRHVFEKVGMMATDYPGMQYEDVDFSFRALKAGLKILYVGGQGAGHMLSGSKRYSLNFSERADENWKEVQRRHLTGASSLLNQLKQLHQSPSRPLVLA